MAEHRDTRAPKAAMMMMMMNEDDDDDDDDVPTDLGMPLPLMANTSQPVLVCDCDR